ncbi:MAG TPA: hypothetical protein VFP65_27165, partial [Anaeromyxobacteraceae bacterium]|nr:hypothetical protein [Anaeromyxobacteraceae bacterium]
LPLLRGLRWVLWPAALASQAAAHLYARRPLQAAPFALLLAAGAAGTGWLAYRVALATARSGGDAGSVGESRASRGGGWFPERLGPLFEKELRYLLRHPAARIHLVLVPVLAAFLGWKVPGQVAGEAAPLVAGLPLFGIAAYVHLALQLFWLNALGFDRGGARTFFLAPVAPERVLLAKNAALLAWALAIFTLASATYVAFAGPQPWWAAWGALALVLGLAPVLYGLGNLLGVVAPRAASHGLQRAGAVSPLAALAGMGITAAGVGLYAGPVLLAAALDALWVVPLAWAVLAGAAFAAWRATLPLAGRLLAARREQVLAAVCGDDA